MASTSLGVTPSRDAASRSMTSDVCRPLSWVSVLTSASSGNALNAARTLGSQARRSPVRRPATCTGTGALLWRPPMRMSCTGCRKRLAPGSLASFTRRRATTWSAVSLRSDKRLQRDEHHAGIALRTAGEADDVFHCRDRCRTMFMKSASFWRIAWKEMLWSAWIPADQPSRVLLREEALGNDHVQVDIEADGASKHEHHPGAVPKDEREAAAVPLKQCRERALARHEQASPRTCQLSGAAGARTSSARSSATRPAISGSPPTG